jgi:putative solute:sodium symporter small subunit
MAAAKMDRQTYWRKQLQRTVVLLVVWFIVGYGFSIFLIEPLNSLSLGGVPLGFWMAQQGSIFIFVVLILVYAISAGRLDRDAGVEEG